MGGDDDGSDNDAMNDRKWLYFEGTSLRALSQLSPGLHGVSRRSV